MNVYVFQSLQTDKTFSLFLLISACFLYLLFFSSLLFPAGHKFVWPPQKTSTQEPVLTSNATPSLPSYRPPPNTQHAKIGSPLSPTPHQAPLSPTPAFGGAPLSKMVPQTSPKPRNQAVHQSTKAQTWNVSGSSQTTTKSSTGLMQSGVPMNAGSGSKPAPRRGRGQMKSQVATGARIPICNICGTPIR